VIFAYKKESWRKKENTFDYGRNFEISSLKQDIAADLRCHHQEPPQEGELLKEICESIFSKLFRKEKMRILTAVPREIAGKVT
jgi:hypothetical protein